MDDIGFCEVVPTVTALEPQIPDHDINLEDIFEEDDIEITESDDVLKDDEEYVMLHI